MQSSLTLPLFIEVSVPSHESKWSCVGHINFVSFYEFSIELSNCFDSAVFCLFHFIHKYITFGKTNGMNSNVFVFIIKKKIIKKYKIALVDM